MKVSIGVLECGDGTSSKVWRALRASAQPLTVEQLYTWINIQDTREQISVNAVQQSLKLLRRHGWVEVSGSYAIHARGRAYHRLTFVANQEPAIRVRPPKELQESSHAQRIYRIRTVRDRLTLVAKKAHEARYSALATTMGSALAEIELEARALRDMLILSRGRSAPETKEDRGDEERQVP